MSKSKVLFILTGSIAAYKACQALSRLNQAGVDIQVVATTAALQFIGKATIEGLVGKKVLTDLYEDGQMMDHIRLVRWADLIVVAPASANYINKIASGVADDLASTIFLAHDFTKPWLLAPAMNAAMYKHPNTLLSLEKLKKFGVEVIEPSFGNLACGEVGPGRLVEADILTDQILKFLSKFPGQAAETKTMVHHSLQKNILITAGGTAEVIDGVRVLTNVSSGKTGHQLAETFSDLGFNVELLLAKTSAVTNISSNIQVHRFGDFSDLKKLLEERLSAVEFSAVIHAAAVSDYSVVGAEIDGHFIALDEKQKLSSDAGELKLVFKRNEKLISKIKSWSKNKKIFLVGFKLTNFADNQTRLEAVRKIFLTSQADIVVQNDLSEISASAHLFHAFQKNSDHPETFPQVPALVEFLTTKIISETRWIETTQKVKL